MIAIMPTLIKTVRRTRSVSDYCRHLALVARGVERDEWDYFDTHPDIALDALRSHDPVKARARDMHERIDAIEQLYQVVQPRPARLYFRKLIKCARWLMTTVQRDLNQKLDDASAYQSKGKH